MAGAGYKLFNTGDVLTAAQVNTYLQEQTVMVFADATARTTALSAVLSEGMVSYLQDTNTLELYNGSAWVSATGDITELTAGTGISITNASGPIPTVAVNSSTVPLLASSNTFSTNQVVSCATTAAALRITQTGSGNALIVEDSSNPDSTPTVIDQNGKVVIGTTAAATTYVAGLSIIPPLQVIGNTNATAATYNARYSNDNSGSFFTLGKSRSTTLGDATGAVLAADNLGGMSFAGSDGTTMVEGARIGATAGTAPSTGSMNGNLLFLTSSASNTPTEKMRIDYNSRIAITGSLSRGAPLQKTADFTLGVSENWIVNMKTGSGLVITLPSASTYAGRELMITNWQAQTVTASASVIVKNNTAADTAILPATIGTWATLVADGTNWIMTQYKDS